MKTSRIAPGFAALLAVSTIAGADDGVKVGGYASIRMPLYCVNSADDAGTGCSSGDFWTANSDHNLAYLGDGAVYLSKALGHGSFTFDLPVIVSGASLAVGGPQAQVFVSYKFDNGFGWKLGRFDGIFGLERNDSNAIEFVDHGAVFDLQPLEHNGIAFSYETPFKVSVTAYLSDDTSVPVDGEAPTEGAVADNKDHQYGVRAAYESEVFHVGVGYRTAGSVYHPFYADLTAGLSVGSLDAGLGLVLNDDGLTVSPLSRGLAAQAIYQFSDGISAGARFNMITAGAAQTTEWTAGPQFALSKAFNLKVDYTFKTIDSGEAGSEADSENRLALSAVCSF